MTYALLAALTAFIFCWTTCNRLSTTNANITEGVPMHRILIPLIILGLFCALAAYSYGRITPTHHGATSEGDFIAQKLAEYRSPDAGVVYQPTKTVSISHWGKFELSGAVTFGTLLQKYRALHYAKIAEPKHVDDKI
jgi:hypothetical protein